IRWRSTKGFGLAQLWHSFEWARMSAMRPLARNGWSTRMRMTGKARGSWRRPCIPSPEHSRQEPVPPEHKLGYSRHAGSLKRRPPHVLLHRFRAAGNRSAPAAAFLLGRLDSNLPDEAKPNALDLLPLRPSFQEPRRQTEPQSFPRGRRTGQHLLAATIRSF